MELQWTQNTYESSEIHFGVVLSTEEMLTVILLRYLLRTVLCVLMRLLL